MKYHKRSTKTADKREAIAFAKTPYEQIVAGKFASASQAQQTSFGYWTQKMLESQRGRVDRGEFSEQAHRNDQYMLDAKILPEFRVRHVKDVLFDALDQLVIKLSAEKLDGSTIQRYLGNLRRASRRSKSVRSKI
ncbi:hypothetical protein [Paraburkholderia caballeronis]|uniref:hypothetical protein n=1 Tax=Paraburkholderia caballeronis TaxID=416943 RepID=UPI001FB8CCA1|nr:hypothetical protein [Paraburkholderia caballeronis]